MAFEIASNVLVRSCAPKWMYWLGLKKLSTVNEAYRTFVSRMRELVHLREREIEKLRVQSGSGLGADVSDAMKDMFGKLVAARMGKGRLALSDEECIADCFLMLLAGHESTANTLSATIAMLGLYQEEQERVYRVIKDVLGDKPPEFEDYEELDEVLACFCEALRMFHESCSSLRALLQLTSFPPSKTSAPAYINFREPTEDTTLILPRQDNPDIVDKLHFRKGTNVLQDYVGIGYDPESFPEPETYRPTRWTTASPYASSSTPTSPPFPFSTPSNPLLPPVPNPSTLDNIHSFSTGPRTCLGHKFTKTEAVCLLTNILGEWRIEVDLSVVGVRGDKKGEELERLRRRWRERVVNPKAKFAITFLFPNLPVRLVRR